MKGSKGDRCGKDGNNGLTLSLLTMPQIILKNQAIRAIVPFSREFSPIFAFRLKACFNERLSVYHQFLPSIH
jgi:hypothetical protein